MLYAVNSVAILSYWDLYLLTIFKADAFEKPTSIPCAIFSNPLFAVMYVDNASYSTFVLIGSKICLHDLPLTDKSFAFNVPCSRK